MSATGVAVVLGLAPGVQVGPDFIRGPFSTTTLHDLALLSALERGVSVQEVDGWGRDIRPTLDSLHRRQHLAWQVRAGDDRGPALLQALVRDTPLPWPSSTEGRAALSRFALVRRGGDAWVMESGRSAFRLHLSDDALTAVWDTLSGRGRDETLLSLVAMAGMLDEGDRAAPLWEFHDRYFASHATTDMQPAGATFRFAGETEPEPFEPGGVVADDEIVSLPIPPLDDPGPGLWRTIETRRSIRDFDDQPVTLNELGTLLWFTLRRQGALLRDPADPRSYDRILRPVPSAGATHALEIWLDCRLVDGLASGMWRYDSTHHALRRAGARNVDVSTRLASLWHSDAEDAPVRGIAVLRHARLAWKYERVALSLALKDFGVMLHALQLVATGVGLGLWPLGASPHEAVLRDLGLSADSHLPLGEFALGHAAPSRSRSTDPAAHSAHVG